MLTIFVSGVAKNGAKTFWMNAGTPSGPVGFHVFNPLRIRSTSTGSTNLKLKPNGEAHDGQRHNSVAET